jgi:hypothetical protein
MLTFPPDVFQRLKQEAVSVQALTLLQNPRLPPPEDTVEMVSQPCGTDRETEAGSAVLLSWEASCRRLEDAP